MAKSQQGRSRARYVQKRKRRAAQVPHRAARTESHDRGSSSNWQAATSQPGEIYTPEGRIRASGAFLSGLLSRNPRRRALQREGIRPLLFMLPLVALIGVVISLVMRLF